MFKILDRYIIRKFLSTFFFMMLLVNLVILTIDYIEKAEDFAGKNNNNIPVPLKIVFIDYYGNLVPYLIGLLTPVFVFLAVIYFTSRLSARTEIVAILSSGISFNRLMLPYLFCAALIAGMSFYLNSWVIPKSTQKRIEIEYRWLRPKINYQAKHLHRRLNSDSYIYIEGYNTENQRADRLTIDRIQDGRVTYRLISDVAIWNSEKQEWSILNIQERFIQYDSQNKVSERIRKRAKLDTNLKFTPDDFIYRELKEAGMTLPELSEFIEVETQRGSNELHKFKVEWHQRFAIPFATFILVIIGVSLSARKVRGGIGLKIGLGVLITFLYILAFQFTTTLSRNGRVPIWLSVWLPNFIFGAVAMVFYQKAKE
ncbi:MAG: LptF/LptG family permease [Bacteroidia bacterium]|nr:LptF/LptG family permease [Bacteroidia bacterium]